MDNNTHLSAMMLGEVAYSGAARGPAFVCTCWEHGVVHRRSINESDIQPEMEKLDAAISRAEQELLRLQDDVQQKIGKREAEMFGPHILLLHDPSLLEKTRALCQREKLNIEAALEETIENLSSTFLRLEDPYFREERRTCRTLENGCSMLWSQASQGGSLSAGGERYCHEGASTFRHRAAGQEQDPSARFRNRRADRPRRHPGTDFGHPMRHSCRAAPGKSQPETC